MANFSGYTGPYGTISIDLSTDGTQAAVTFTNNSVGTNTYLFGDGGIADLNVNGTYTLGTVTETGLTGFSPIYKSNTPGQVDGFGNFNLSLNNSAAFGNSATSVSFTISGNWTSASNVLTANANGYDAAAHVFVCASPCTASESNPPGGYAAEIAGTAPEPAAVVLLGSSMICLGAIVRRRRKRLLARHS
jgi:hypothetical protein